MRRSVPLVASLALSAACASGCAQQAIIVRPGPILVAASGEAVRQGTPWSLQVVGARDVRPEGKTGSKIGTFFTRFDKTPEPAFLEPNPEVYVKEQLSRYLFAKGWEASGPAAASGDLSVELEDFSMVEDPGAVWDTVTVRVAYTVRISRTTGQEIGRVRLEGGAQTKTPLDTERQVEVAFRDAVADTLDALSRSEAFQKAVRQLPP
jgi:hypothetical protein